MPMSEWAIPPEQLTKAICLRLLRYGIDICGVNILNQRRQGFYLLEVATVSQPFMIGPCSEASRWPCSLVSDDLRQGNEAVQHHYGKPRY